MCMFHMTKDNLRCTSSSAFLVFCCCCLFEIKSLIGLGLANTSKLTGTQGICCLHLPSTGITDSPLCLVYLYGFLDQIQVYCLHGMHFTD